MSLRIATSLPIASPPDGLSPSVAALLARAHQSDSLADGLAQAELAYNEAAGTALPTDLAAASHVFCFFLYRTGNMPRAIAIGEAALPWLRDAAVSRAHAETLRWVGLCASDIGQFGLSISCALEMQAMAERDNDPRGRVLALDLLGGCFERSGDPWQGERLLREAVVLARELGEPYPLFASLNNLGAVLIGKFYSLRDSAAAEEAVAALNATLPLSREVARLAPALNDPYFDCFIDGNLGEILVHLGEFDEAEMLLARSLAAALARGYDAVISRVRCSQAELHLARGNASESTRLLNELLSEPGNTQQVATALRAYYGLYLAYRAANAPADALRALENFRRIENQQTLQQLKARSEFMVTRLEADESQRKGLERAYGIAQAHASRAVALERMAHEDELTGLGNRRALDLNLPDKLVTAQLHHKALAVVVLDLDHFKRVNDAFGHAIGDKVLIQVARILGDQTRADDLVTRTGGEEFVLVLPGMSQSDAFDMCERLRLRVSDFQWDTVAPGLAVTLSAGIACAPAYEATALLERADLAMYRAKKAGRNRVAVAPATSA